MNKVLLKNGEEGEIALLNFEQIESLVLQYFPDHNYDNRPLKGFSYLTPSLAHDLRTVDRYHDYSEEINLTALEFQAQMGFSKEKYHKALTLSINKTLAGLLICQWINFDEFWQYHVRYIDVHENHKNKRVGTHLVNALNEVEFVKGRILCMGALSAEGRSYIKHVIKRNLHAKDYALVFEDYMGDIPTEFGIYGGEHWG